MIYLWILAVIFVTLLLAVKYTNGLLYSFFLFFPILPSDFAFKIPFLPRLSASRIMLIGLLIVWLLRDKKWLLTVKNVFRHKSFSFLCFTYFASLAGNTVSGYATVNDCLSFFIQFLLAIIIVYYMINDQAEMFLCLRFTLIGAVVVFGMGIYEFFSGTNLADSLFITNAYSHLSDRLGMTRASVTMSAIRLGYFCTFMYPVICALSDKFKNKFYSIAKLLCICTCICTISRGAILLIIIEMFYFELYRNRRITKLVVLRSMFFIMAGFGFVIFLTLNKENVISRIIESTLNSFNSDYYSAEINNNHAVESRLGQLTIIKWIFLNGRIMCGFGPNAYADGNIYYLRTDGMWWRLTAGDTGIPTMVAIGGILLLSGFIAFYIALFNTYIVRYKSDKTMLGKAMFISILLLFISNISSVYFLDNYNIIVYALLLKYSDLNYLDHRENQFKNEESVYGFCNNSYI